MGAAGRGIRLDKWLWRARFFRTRGLAAKMVSGGHVRVNSIKVSKPAASVKPGDTLVFLQGRHVRVIRVAGEGVRRGPAAEARTLYEDLSPPTGPMGPPQPMFEGKGRPTKKDRRAAAALKGATLE